MNPAPFGETARHFARKCLSTTAFALFFLYAVASHFFPDNPLYATLPLAVSLAIALLLAVPSAWRYFAGLVCVAGIWVVWHYDPAWLVYAPPVLLQSLVGIFFLSTLRDPDRNLIARIVELVHGEPRPEFLAYTKRLTLAWGIFLLGMALAALMLAVFAPHEWWSIFANVLSYVLFGAFFVLEYLYRRWRFPDADHAGPMRVAAAIRRHGLFRPAEKGD